jgi:hypothetical protein
VTLKAGERGKGDQVVYESRVEPFVAGTTQVSAQAVVVSAGDDLLPFDTRPLPFEQAQLGCPFGSQEVWALGRTSSGEDCPWPPACSGAV